MLFKYCTALLLAGLLFFMAGCGHDHGPDSHTHEDQSNDGNITTAENGVLQPLSFTIRTSKSELFVEFIPLVLGEESRFAAHFTDMDNFKAIEEGSLTVRLCKENEIVTENTADEPSSPGIFRPVITPHKEGLFRLDFLIRTTAFSDTIMIHDIMVYSNKEAAMAGNPPQPEGDEISFLKEQAWKIDFALSQVKQQPIHNVIHASGNIQPIKREEKVISAKSSGIVFFRSPNLQEGLEVKAGESLFILNSAGLLQANIKERYLTVKARFDKTKADFERAETLLAQQIIGMKEYEQRKMDYAVAEAELQTLNNSYSSQGQSIAASMSGIVKKVLVNDGQYVEEGDPLAEITRNRRLLIRAELSQKYIPELRKIRTANFTTPYMKEVQSIDNYNGQLVSYGNVIDEESGFVPVLFELDNLGELIPGSFVELYLLTKPIENALVIPKTALMQDYNTHYVYIQKAGESFEKREVALGVDDGVNVQIITGVSEGEWVVIKGAYQIKMASMSTTIPAHGHEH